MTADKLTLRPRMVRRPVDVNGCWARLSLTGQQFGILPCPRHARPGFLTCGIHRDWEAAAREEAALIAAEARR